MIGPPIWSDVSVVDADDRIITKHHPVSSSKAAEPSGSRRSALTLTAKNKSGSPVSVKDQAAKAVCPSARVQRAPGGKRGVGSAGACVARGRAPSPVRQSDSPEIASQELVGVAARVDVAAAVGVTVRAPQPPHGGGLPLCALHLCDKIVPGAAAFH